MLRKRHPLCLCYMPVYVLHTLLLQHILEFSHDFFLSRGLSVEDINNLWDEVIVVITFVQYVLCDVGACYVFTVLIALKYELH